ncbi:MAG: hypothetical protein U1F36_02430 [Planctomycetota bacterium]
MTKSAPSVLSLVLIPSILTLAVTGLRVYGELHDWGPMLVGTRQGGGEGGYVAITWLMFVFGLWFGIRLQRSPAALANRKRAFMLSVAGAVVLIAAMAGLSAAGLVSFPDKEHPVVPHGAPYLVAALALSTIVSFTAWPRAAFALLVYAALARIPVLVVTKLAIDKGWDVHYAKFAPGFVPPPHDELFMNLALPQVTFWPAATVISGTLMASLGALLAGQKRER